MMTNEQILQERDLVRQCQAGDQAAWTRLFHRYWWCVWKAARAFLRSEGRNDDLVDEIAAQVWAYLGYGSGKRLRGFDPEQGRLATLLVQRTWQVVQKDRQQRRRRRRREVEQDPQAPEPVAPGAAAEISDWRLQEFFTTLAEWEVIFWRDVLLHAPTAEALAAMSEACFRKRVQRQRWKLRAFLYG
jgi:DNA-directed RNA polymerase specialized sigma24 family protein